MYLHKAKTSFLSFIISGSNRARHTVVIVNKNYSAFMLTAVFLMETLIFKEIEYEMLFTDQFQIYVKMSLYTFHYLLL